MILTSAVIGLGKIGQEYDEHDLNHDKTLTHANAFMKHPGYRLIAGVDPDPVKRDKFEKRFQQKSYADIQSLYADVNPEVLALSIPTHLHYSVFQELIQYQPKGIICEKPIAQDLFSANRMVHLTNQTQVALLVNYMRRFEPGVQRIKKIIENNEIGEVVKVVAHYSKGILNNGSHMIDLILFLLGNIQHFKIIKSGRKWQQLDPEPDVYCLIENIDVYLIAGREEHYTIFDLEIFGSKGVIKYQYGGRSIKLYRTEQDNIFNNYTFLVKTGEDIPHDYYNYQWHVVENLYQHLTKATPILSNGTTALNTLKIISCIIDSLEEKVNG
jgi:predicted dehydrogenase